MLDHWRVNHMHPYAMLDHWRVSYNDLYSQDANLRITQYLIWYGCFQKYAYPQIIHSNKVFHYKPSILGYPYFWKHPYLHEIYINIGFHRISALEQLELRLDTKWLPFLEIPWSWGVTSPEHLWIPCFANILLFFFFDSQTFLAFFWVEPQTWSLWFHLLRISVWAAWLCRSKSPMMLFPLTWCATSQSIHPWVLFWKV